MGIFALLVFRDDSPDVTRFATVSMIRQDVKALLIQLIGATGDLAGVGVGGTLKAANHHAEIIQFAISHLF
jgi:hypothetical protein